MTATQAQHGMGRTGSRPHQFRGTPGQCQVGVAVAWTRWGAGCPHGLDMGRQLASTNQYKVVHAHARTTGGLPWHPWPCRYVYACLYAYTFVHVARQLGACSRPQTPQTLTGIGFYVGWCWVAWSGWGGAVCEHGPWWCWCLKVVQAVHSFCTHLYRFSSPSLYQFVPPCTAQRLIYIGIYVCGTNQYKPVQVQSNAVVQRYNTLWVYRCTAYQFQVMNQ